MNKKLNAERIMIIMLVSLGIFLRFAVMTFGHNFDFDSYCIVGEIAGYFRNVYAETSRYNYGPLFFCIQGFLYRLSHLSPNWESTYRVLMVSVLTLADLGIMCFIANQYSIRKSLVFFLNPVSIIITGYHNQFDNIAVFCALLCILSYNEEERFTKKDWLFVATLSLSLIMKHILFLFPLYILVRRKLPIKKKLVYVFVPPIIFLMSFVPFVFQNQAALDGVLNNVFFYKSFNNSPLLYYIYKLIDFPMEYCIVVFGLCLSVVAYATRRKTFDEQLLLYLISMVAFSSAIANQYLVIPMAAICVLNTGVWKYIYMFLASAFLILEGDGLGLLNILESRQMIPQSTQNLFNFFGSKPGGYVILVWVLFAILLYLLLECEKKHGHLCTT